MQLTTHFTLEELTKNSRGFDNTPSDVVIERLRWLCSFLLEPIRAKFGPVKVTSGYRGGPFNAAVSGAPRSNHLGYDFVVAADIQVPGTPLEEVFDWIRLESGLRFDKVILERGKQERHEWDDCIHIQMQPKPRRIAMTGATHNASGYQFMEVK